jgi:segregation and condensation protein A
VYRVRLTDFEGPLDLLLFFIRRDELDIYDIPISKITAEFLDYLHLIASLDLEVAGEFIVMAATLMQIKVRMLLPHSGQEDEEEDPRAELVRRLIEYKRYKEMSQKLSEREDRQRLVYYRKFYQADAKEAVPVDTEEAMRDVTMFNLIAAYKSALDHMPRRVVHEVQMLNVSIEEQISFTLDYLRVHGSTTLLTLVSHMTDKIRIIVTVIALLEMTKNKLIVLGNVQGGDDISISPVVTTAVPVVA